MSPDQMRMGGIPVVITSDFNYATPRDNEHVQTNTDLTPQNY